MTIKLKSYDAEHFYFGEYLVDLSSIRLYYLRIDGKYIHTFGRAYSIIKYIATKLYNNKNIEIYSRPAYRVIQDKLTDLRKCGYLIPECALSGKLTDK